MYNLFVFVIPVYALTGILCFHLQYTLGALVVLDAHPDGIIYQEMIHDYVQIVRTVYEG